MIYIEQEKETLDEIAHEITASSNDDGTEVIVSAQNLPSAIYKLYVMYFCR